MTHNPHAQRIYEMLRGPGPRKHKVRDWLGQFRGRTHAPPPAQPPPPPTETPK